MYPATKTTHALFDNSNNMCLVYKSNYDYAFDANSYGDVLLK